MVEQGPLTDLLGRSLGTVIRQLIYQNQARGTALDDGFEEHRGRCRPFNIVLFNLVVSCLPAKLISDFSPEGVDGETVLTFAPLRNIGGIIGEYGDLGIVELGGHVV